MCFENKERGMKMQKWGANKVDRATFNAHSQTGECGGYRHRKYLHAGAYPGEDREVFVPS